MYVRKFRRRFGSSGNLLLSVVLTKQKETISFGRRVAGIAAPIILGLVLAAWIVRSAVVSDYYEPGVLVLGVASFFCLLAAKWRVSLFVKAPICMILLVFIALAGIGLENFGRYRQRVGMIEARALLINVAGGLNRMSEVKGDIPDCAFPCMAKSLVKSGKFKPYSIPYANGSGSLAVNAIPNRDPWNCRWFYRKLGPGAFVLRSSGADRRFHTSDDITVTSAIPQSGAGRALPAWEGWFHKQPPAVDPRPAMAEPGMGDDEEEHPEE